MQSIFSKPTDLNETQPPHVPPDFVNALKAHAETTLLAWLKEANAPHHVCELAGSLVWLGMYEDYAKSGAVSYLDNQSIMETIANVATAINELGGDFETPYGTPTKRKPNKHKGAFVAEATGEASPSAERAAQRQVFAKIENLLRSGVDIPQEFLEKLDAILEGSAATSAAQPAATDPRAPGAATGATGEASPSFAKIEKIAEALMDEYAETVNDLLKELPHALIFQRIEAEAKLAATLTDAGGAALIALVAVLDTIRKEHAQRAFVYGALLATAKGGSNAQASD